MTANEFENFWIVYSKDIYRFCLHLARGRDDADDLYQETALRAFKKAEEIDESDNPKAFIFSIAVKLAHNLFKKEKRRAEIAPESSIDDDEFGTELTDGAEPIEKQSERKQIQRAVRRTLTALDEKYRVPLVLFYFDERGIDFIAEVMKIPTGTVKSRLHKAKQLMKSELEKEGVSDDEYR